MRIFGEGRVPYADGSILIQADKVSDGTGCATRLELVPMPHDQLSGGAAPIIKNVGLEGTDQRGLSGVDIAHDCNANVVLRYRSVLNERYNTATRLAGAQYVRLSVIQV